MGLKRRVQRIGNSLALVVPNEIFEFLELNPTEVKYKLCQDETGSVFVAILGKDVTVIDEKKFQKHGKSFTLIIPKSLCTLWNVGLLEGQNRELELSFDDSSLKWRLNPV